MRLRWVFVLFASLALSTSTCRAQSEIPLRARTRSAGLEAVEAARPIRAPITIRPPLGLPPVPVPEDNPPTAETIALGRKLFFEKLFSRDGSISCASCHDPRSAFTDLRRVSQGVGGRLGDRNSMVILNAAYNITQFWDGRAASLEEQAAGPVPHPDEFAHSLAGVERKLSADPVYVEMFAKAFGPGRITYDMVAKSIASYERTLLSGNSPFDRYQFGGDRNALSESARRGLTLFMDIRLDGPNCISCHRIEPGYATFTEPRFHNTGVAFNPANGSFTDPGRFRITGRAVDRGAFKVPTLRNIALTAPYMHDGSMKTLEEVVDFYFEGGRPNPLLSGVMPHVGIPAIPRADVAQAKKDLVEFMKALTGEIPPP